MAEPPLCQGWLEKKSGGKEGKHKLAILEKWDKRYFVLSGTQLVYYKGEDDHTKGAAALGGIELPGAELFLKEVQGQAFRFTIKSADRELKLRAPNGPAYHNWADAIAPLVKATGRDSSQSVALDRAPSIAFGGRESSTSVSVDSLDSIE